MEACVLANPGVFLGVTEVNPMAPSEGLAWGFITHMMKQPMPQSPAET